MTKTELCEEEDGRLVMHIEGRLDTPDADKVKKDMQELNECHDRDIVLDLTGLKYVCSSGLRLFFVLLRTVKPNGCEVIIKGANQSLMEIFESTGFVNMLQFV